MRRICVFCGSSPGSRAEYRAATEELGAELVRRSIGLVYGGGNVGLMGVLADAVLKAGGEAGSHPGEPHGTRGRPQRAYQTPRCALYARAQGTHGRSIRCVYRLAGWIRHTGRVLRSANVGATRLTCEALRHPERAGVLLPLARDVRSCR